MKWEASGLYTNKAGCQNGAKWWRMRGHLVRVAKVVGGWKHYRRPLHR